MLYHLLYVSDLNDEIACDMDRLVRKSKAHNAGEGVTGALWFDGHTFVQLLEGSRPALGRTLTYVHKSTAHVNFELVLFRLAPERLFSDWSMAYFRSGPHERDIVRRFSAAGDFQPRSMSAESLVAFMRYLEMERQVSAAQAI